jgi:integrase
MVRKNGQLINSSLGTVDLSFAKRKLAALKSRLDRTDPKYGKISFYSWLKDVYYPTLTNSEGTRRDKWRIIERIKRSWLAARSQPMSDLKPSQVEQWLSKQYGDQSASYYNSALLLIRGAFDLAVRDKVIADSPASGLKFRKRDKPIRLTPTFEQFKSIVAHVRAQRFNSDAQDSADLLEAGGLLGLGQAELAGMKREDIDLESGRIIVYRHKTDTGFVIPIYPQARPLIEKLCTGKKAGARLFPISNASKSLSSACRSLGYPPFTHRSLRRMFIVRCIELGVDVKVLAEWQGHKDGGKLILDTYSHVNPIHSNRMAALLTDAQPENVVPMQREA